MATPLSQRLLFVSGKGGVGKSTVAAALALSFARRGERTLVCEINTDERITHLLERPPVGPELQQIEKNLWAVDIRPQEAMREYALMVLKFKAVYRAVFENRLVRHFLRLIPSLQELVMIGKIFYHLRQTEPDGSPTFHRVVVDAPATGHAISFLSVPQVLLDTVPPGPMSQEAQVMRDLLVDPAVSGAVLVTLPEEMPLNETFELAQSLRDKVHLRHVLTVLNTHVAPRFGAEDLVATGKVPGLARWVGAHAAREQASAEALERLKRLEAPVVALPRLFEDRFGRSTVEKLADVLTPLLGDPR
jgi:anion-transporting  ArsA/GET3 family ATPase